ncbi:hypothetical protein [Mesorhizobium sp. M0058]|uniref:hypothetical protein n=1 Tax=Mesorhizobium sp. M0058 TaxID=2956865 RepID=UPI003339E81A
MELSNLKRDSKMVEGGKWVDEIPGMGNLRLRVRGMSSPTFAALRGRKQRKVPKSDREADGAIKTDVDMRLLGEALHEAVLLEWDGLTEDGKPVPFDKDLALTWLTDPDYMPFADAVVWAASFVDRSTAEAQGGLEKNSRKPSPGSSSGGTQQPA